MGVRKDVICRNCGCRFQVCEGGGFLFHKLHCDICGAEKNIKFGELGDLHLRFLKGLNGPYCIVSSEQDRLIQQYYPGTPLRKKEYVEDVEKIAGSCSCGGHFRMDAKPKCPECGSEEYDDAEDGMVCMYD